MKFPNPKKISFREEITDVKNTNYLTHSLYYHPAKFIPQIVRYCLDNYTKKGGKTLDPFAGSGTTGLEASINGYSSILTDINPLLDLFYSIKIPKFKKDYLKKRRDKLYSTTDNIYILKNINNKNINVDKRLVYWYPEDLLSYFTYIKKQIDKEKNGINRTILTLTFLKIAKKYSFAEHSMPKLFTSKRKRMFIDKLNKNNSFFTKIAKETKLEINKIIKTVNELQEKYSLSEVVYYSGVDAYSFNYKNNGKVDSVITSPPYLQAQEYMRTFKLEMMWLGYTDKKIRSFINKEIPFRKPEGRIKGYYIDRTRKKIKSKKLREMYDSYFWFTIKSLENAANCIKKGGKLCVLIGNPVMEGNTVEIWKVFCEYFTKNKKYKLVDVFEDKIVTRKLFNGRKNKNPNGMRSEFLLVLEK